MNGNSNHSLKMDYFNESIPSSSKELFSKNFESRTDLSDVFDETTEVFRFVNNISNLDDRSAENVVKLIKYRFFEKRFYTWSGHSLLAVQHKGCFDEKVGVEEPSIQAVVEECWFKLSNRLGKINQSIIISGDSGSGKTYSACVALKYLGHQSKICNEETLKNVLHKTWCSIPILEAFGNAATRRNSNSSRFGKFIQIQCKNNKVVGALVRSYMLERARVSGPNNGESNFHIFGQLLMDAGDVPLGELNLNNNIKYKINPEHPYTLHGSFEDTIESMKTMNIQEIDDILKILAIILHLGNIEFSIKDDKLGISLESQQYIQFCAKLLECNHISLRQVLLKRLIAPKLRRGSLLYTSCVNVDECEGRRNSLMRFLYDELFSWLIRTINKQIFYEGDHEHLGILDIYGFESFCHNTFEQLCINYANERLQQYYINDFYNKQVNFMYEKCEKITSKFDMSEYNRRINLLDGAVSVFAILNEECLVKRYNSDVFIGSRLSSGLKKHECFIDKNGCKNTTFAIKHYAGIVDYDCRSMVNKNRDKLPEEILLLLKDSNLSFLSKMISISNEEINFMQNKTLLNKFKKSLDNLMVTLDKTDAHYIKCLKPNEENSLDYFDEVLFKEQLKYNGILETLKLEFQMFSTVLPKTEFSRRFDVKTIKQLKNALRGKIYIGRDKIWFKENSFELIMKYRSILIRSSVKIIQRSWRRHNASKEKAASSIQKFFRKLLDSKKNICGSDVPADMETKTTLKPIDVETEVKNFPRDMRTIFKSERIISRQRISEVPIRFHIRRTCMPFSHVLPSDELPKGLLDIY